MQYLGPESAPRVLLRRLYLEAATIALLVLSGLG